MPKVGPGSHFLFLWGLALRYRVACSLAINFYLDDLRSTERADIAKLARRDDPNDNALIMGYIREAQSVWACFSCASNIQIVRVGLAPQFPGVFRDVAADAIVARGNRLFEAYMEKGDRAYADFRTAHLNVITGL
jgi:hypothetical protein